MSRLRAGLERAHPLLFCAYAGTAAVTADVSM